jgi:hypothetical protein
MDQQTARQTDRRQRSDFYTSSPPLCSRQHKKKRSQEIKPKKIYQIFNKNNKDSNTKNNETSTQEQKKNPSQQQHQGKKVHLQKNQCNNKIHNTKLSLLHL